MPLPILGKFLCTAVTLVTFSSELSSLNIYIYIYKKKIQIERRRKKQKLHKHFKQIQTKLLFVKNLNI